ncbi:MAG: hypothetical protein FWD63_09365 [Propionibacteriaceae bacterium]|nr:hypothetical protein [Propionibacteriaceae bacterium]
MTDQPLRCLRCGSENIAVQAVNETQIKHRGCLGWTLWILLAVCTIGLIIIIPLITNSKTKTKKTSVAVCQSCGNRWEL